MAQKKNKKPLGIVCKSAARVAAVQILYNLLSSKKSIDQVFSEYISSFKKDLESEFDIETLDNEYLQNIIFKFDDDYKQIISKYLTKNWSLERISNVDKAILLSGIIELKQNINLSKKIIISEYIEIANQMGGEAKFVNKVLDKFSEDFS